MERLSHGELLLDSASAVPTASAAVNSVPCPPTTNFGYLFPNLQDDPSKRLPDLDLNKRRMAEALIELGNSMIDPDSPALDSDNDPIPSVLTYFGQFITHEVVFEITTEGTLGRGGKRNFRRQS